MRTFLLTYFLKPAASADTEYGPGGRNGSTYVPSALLVVLYFAPVSFSVTMIFVPGTTADCGSITRPLNVPRNSRAGASAGSRRAKTHNAMRDDDIVYPLCSVKSSLADPTARAARASRRTP